MIEKNTRYSRQFILPEIGEAGQALLADAAVLIIGVGGLGCPVAQYLAAIGVGRIGLMDHDKVQPSNLNRQILFGPADCDRLKVDVVAEKLRAQNPDLQFDSYPYAFSHSIDETMLESYDLLIDASDNMQTKYSINDVCVGLNKPWVGASLHKFEGQLSVFNLKDSPTYRCLFPQQNSAVPSCEEAGVLGVVPGLLGMMQAMEVAKILLKIGQPLAGRLKTIDFLSGREMSFDYSRNEQQVQIARENWNTRFKKSDLQLPDFNGTYLDVREIGEQPILIHDKLIQIPINELADRHEEIPTDEPVIVICQTGRRSGKAVEFLERVFDFDNLQSAEAGYLSLLKKEEV